MTTIYGVFSDTLHVNGCTNVLKQLVQPFILFTKANHIITPKVGFGGYYNNGDSSQTAPVLNDSSENLAITGIIRLNDRTSLIDTLSVPSHLRSHISDTALVLSAYKKWGIDCVQHLSGDYAIAIWDGNKEHLYCIKDHFGTVPFYYHYHNGQFVFASDIQQLIKVDGVPTMLNENKLLPYIIDIPYETFKQETWFQDIYTIPSATVLTVNKDGLKQNTYWEPAIGEQLSFKTENDYRAAFKDIFFRAVGDRMRSNQPISALLSGGLDSSAIVAVAANILAQQNKQLHVFSSVLPQNTDSDITDERYYVDQFKTFENVNIQYVTAQDKGPFSNISKLQSHHTIAPLTSRHYLYDDFGNKAEQLNAEVILDGLSGELGPTTSGIGIYAEQFKKLQWQWLWRELNARKKVTGESILRNLYSNVFKILIPDSTINNKSGALDNIKLFQYTFINPKFANNLISLLQSRKDEVISIHKKPIADHKQNQLALIKIVQQKANPQMTFNTGVYSYPFRDIRVLQFALNTPLEYKIRNGYKRYMIRSGLDGILPEEIQWRNSKKPFSPDYFIKYNTQLPLVKDFLNSITPNDPVRQIVDVELLKKWANVSISNNEKKHFNVNIAMHYLPLGIYLISFLRRFREFQ